ncbi:hypothetical protein [Xenorhabdus cabanillasii]|uniref:Uncharacterized protein n=2 Tax=Xenorhabdus cabanillasii TaxID=351673 RepID=A0A3D9UH88_9GAMM|nr:hypothetical protein [Xenorhabdus cabanillasii]PHM75416.1 hypothetical protein Xcab_04099 [Xenorhabdus cabanillasii JM26]REF28656.1 hypothetical protein BDD26_3603 [Xenorhabdus cabanillasii]CDL86469.1 conserved exported hypothetical protein [Xenorhabdus cabanillasii JM26]
MKYRHLFVFVVLLFPSLPVMTNGEYWYYGCPKYSEKGMEEIMQKIKNIPFRTISELQGYSKGEAEMYIKKTKCDLRNLDEYAQELKKRIKKDKKSTDR